MVVAKGPAPSPCSSCPYRRDVPPAVWAPEEYRKLLRYDEPTGQQPVGLFQCHQNGADEEGRLCAGWVGCHNNAPPGHDLMALRIAVACDRIDGSVYDYVSPVPLFASGREAADHGMSVRAPGRKARALIDKIETRRPEVHQR